MIFSRWLPQGLPILLYHRVGDDNSPLSVSPKQFNRQMQFLKNRGYETINPNGILNGKNFYKKILLTFDDGWLDNLTTAAPILKKFGFTATIFISTDYIGKTGSFAKNEIDKNAPMLNAKEISELEEFGWKIANHFASHNNLTELSEAEIISEFNRAKQKLSSIVRNQINLNIISYPRNRATAEVKEIIKKAGALMTFGGQRRMYYQNDTYDLPRLEIFANTSLLQFKLLLTRSYNFIKDKINGR